VSTPRLAVDFPCFAIGLSRAFEKCAALVAPAAAVTGTDWACAVATAKKPIAAAARTVTNALFIEVSRGSGCAAMYNPTRVKTSPELPVPDQMKAWVLGGPDELLLRDKPTPVPGRAEVLVRIDAVAICATDLEIIHVGSPARIQGGLPFNKNFTPGHEYMGTVAALGPDVDEFAIGERVTVEIHAGCGQCKRCRQGMYTSCLNYGRPEKGHRANGFTTDGGFAEYAVNHINTLVRVPDTMSDPEATLVVTAGTSMYGLTELGGLVAGESVVVIGPGPIGLLAVAVAKALGASPVILTGTRNKRLAIGQELGADRVVNINDEDAVEVVKQLTGGIGADYVIECAGSEATIDQAIHMTNRGGKICLAAFPHEPVTTDIAHLVRNNIYVYGIRGEGRSATHRALELMAEKRFDATRIHTHTFPLADLPTALRYARERVEDAIKVVVINKQASAIASAAE
jgi:2-desacetyl-2-hydroxyethyl bacteriochlorophyllide A dehydrogenase